LKKLDKRNSRYLIAVVTLISFDVLTTAFALKNGAEELNPIAAHALNALGPQAGLIVTYAAMLLFFIYGDYIIGKSKKTKVKKIWFVVLILNAFVRISAVTNNLFVIGVSS